jgi:hypothetical protein
MPRMPTTIPDLAIALIVSQFGVASRRQLLHSARSAKAVDNWVRHGLLIRMHRGVYRLRGVPITSEMRLMAAILRCGDDALAGPRMSAALHMLEGFALDGDVDVVAATARCLSKLDFEVVALDVGAADRCTVREIPALARAATLVELAPALSEKAWRVAFDSARRQGLTLAGLERAAQRLGDRPGSPIVLGYLASGRLQPDGEGERRLQRVLVGFDPQPEWGVTDAVPGRRLDCLWREVNLALEYDGRDHHVLPTDRDSDGFRDLECEAHGIKVLRITKGMLDEDAAGVRALIEGVYHRRLLDTRAAPQ